MPETEKPKELSWTAPEFIHYPKSRVWYITIVVVGLVFVVFFLFQKDLLTAALFILLTILVLYFSRQRPREIAVKIDARGLKLNDLQIRYDNLKSFWIVYDPPAVKILNFETTAYLNRYLTIQLADQDPVAARDLLLEHLPEDLDKEEQISDKIARKLKF